MHPQQHEGEVGGDQPVVARVGMNENRSGWIHTARHGG